MQWWEIECVIHSEASEAVSALMQDWPEVQGVAIEGVTGDISGRELYGDWFDDSLLRSEYATVRCYVPDYVSRDELEKRIHQLLDTVQTAGLRVDGPSRQVAIREVAETDWENAWKEHFQPLPVGRGFVIVPKWEWPQYNPGERLPIILEPGMAFGTGTHATTQLCLEALEDADVRNKRVLDIGCGTAILSIGAGRLGAKAVVAVDIDPVAVSVGAQNVAENNLSRTVQVRQGDLLKDFNGEPGFDVAIANILRDAVILLTPQAFAMLKPDGLYITSGYVLDQWAPVENALIQAGFEVIHKYHREDWLAVLARKIR